ncbi:MAG: STAS domain-containing protein [Oscillospiraceae bacterium]|nr:STAS domain-containing protein [Oscillospiraceae bacterium]
MTISKIHSENKTIMALSGRLDTTTAPQLQEVLIPEFSKSKHIELDFSELSYVSSAGLRVLLMGEKAAKSSSGKLTLSNVSQEIKEVFDMTGFSDMLTVV